MVKAPSILLAAVLICPPLHGAPTAPPLPESYTGHSVVTSGGFLYSAGGLGGINGGAVATKVYYSPVGADGSLGAWREGPDLPEPVFFHAGASAAGALYLLGGFHYTDQLAVSNVVYYSRPGADGRPGPWQTTSPLPVAVFFPSAAFWNGRLYVAGGWTGSELSAGVYSAEVRADGSLGPWVAQRPLPEGVYTHAAVSAGTLYVLGGSINGGNIIFNGVYAARIAADGGLEPWRLDTPMPEPVSNHAAAIAGGRVYVTGGWTGPGPTNAVNVSDIGQDGALSDWREFARLPKLLYLHAAAAWDRWLYVVGGSDGQYTQDAVHVLELPAPLPPPQPDDSLPPRTTLAFEGTRYGAAPVFVAPEGLLKLAAVDDRVVVGDGAGVGVRQTLAALDEAPLSPYVSALPAGTEGAHWLRFASVDLAGHEEEPRAQGFAVDGTAPRVAIAAGAPSVMLADGRTVLGPGSRLAVEAEDPVVNGAASGLARVSAAVDDSPVDPALPFSFPPVDGLHVARAGASDNLGHEASVARSFLVDATGPRLSWRAQPAPVPAFDGGAAWLRGDAAVSVAGEDPLVGGAASGFHHAEFSVDGGTWTPAASFGLEEGLRRVALRGFDAVGNEAASAFELRVDAAAPRTDLVLGAPAPTPDTEFSLLAQDPVSGGLASGVAEVSFSVDGGPAQAYAAPFRLPEGAHTLDFWARDLAGNVEPRRSAPVLVKPSDTTAPVTELVVGAPSAGEGPIFISPATPLSLRAFDAGGVASSFWALDEGAFSVYDSTFSVALEGARWVRYFSVDAAGNQEYARATAVAVDATAPAVGVSFGSPRALLAGGETVVSPLTHVSAAAEDPLGAGLASGLDSVSVLLDGRPVEADAGFVIAGEGSHELTVSARDRVGHSSWAKATVLVDATGPSVSWSAEPAAVPATDGGAPWLRGGARVVLSASDPVSGGVAAGAHHAEYSVDGVAWTSASSFGLDEGSWSVAARAVDNVGNVGAQAALSFRVDATPPSSTLALGTPVTSLFGREVATPATPIELSSEDSGSGVARLTYSIDGGPETEYAGAFRLGPGEHTVSYGAYDRAGNEEARKTSVVAVSAFLSESVQALDSVTLDGGAQVSGSVRAGGAFTANGGSVVFGDVVAASTRLVGKSRVEGSVTETAATASEALSLPAARAAAEGEAIELGSGSELALAEGSYRVSSVKLSGRSRLTVSGRVTLFVSGDIEVSGGATINAEGSAEDLWVVSDGGRVSVHGKGRAAWHLYAPRAEVSFGGGGQFVGRVLGRTVALSGNSALPPGGFLPPLRRGGGPSARAPKAPDSPAKGGKGRGSDGESEVLEARLERGQPKASAGREPRGGAPERSAELLPEPAKVSASRRLTAAVSARAERARVTAPAAGALERRDPAPRLAREAVLALGPAPAGTGRVRPAVRRRAASLPPLPVPARAALSVVGQEGREVRSSAGAGVVVPPGAAAKPVALTVSPASEGEASRRRRDEAKARRGLSAAGAAVEYGPHGTRFEKPVTLELPFDPALADAQLAAHYWNPSTEEWEALPSSVDRKAGVVRAQTDHFSLYQVLAGGSPAAAAAGELSFGEVYAFPNPARPGQTPTIHVDAGTAESVEVRVYDVSGRLVTTLSRSGSGDLAWDGAGAGTGVYLFVVTARKGGATISTKGRLAVIR